MSPEQRPVDVMLAEAQATALTVTDQGTQRGATRLMMAISAYDMGVETGLAIALDSPERARRLLADIDAVIHREDQSATVQERTQVLRHYREGIPL